MKFVRIAAILSALSVCQAQAQTSGSVTNHAFALGKGAGVTGYTSLLCTSAQLAVGQAAADPICQTITGDVTISAAGVTAIGAGIVHSSMLNADVFSTAHSWSATQSFPNNSLTLAELPTIGANTVLGSVAGGGSTTNGNQTLNSSYNVSSVSRSSVGVYSVTFSTPFADTNFACMATNGSGGSINGWGQVGAKTTTTILLNFLSNSSTAFDPTKGDVVCFGLE